MYKRLIIVSAIIFTAFAAFSIFGFHSISLHAEGLEGKRIVEFSEVAEQIRVDVNQKLNKFRQTEQKRPYTDYQYFYAPDTANNGFNNGDNVILRSPLAESMSHGMAYGHFQIEPNGKIITPFYAAGLNEKLDTEKQLYISNLNENIANSLKENADVTTYLDIKRKALARKTPEKSSSRIADLIKSKTSGLAKSEYQKKSAPKGQQLAKNGRANYNVNTFQEEGNQKSQIIKQSRSTVYVNQISNSMQSSEGGIYDQLDQGSQQEVAAEVIANNQSQNSTYYLQARRQTPSHGRRIIEISESPAPQKPRGSLVPRQIPSAESAKSRKKDASRDPAADPEIKKSVEVVKAYSKNTKALNRPEETIRVKNKILAKEKDAYDESQGLEDYKHNSTSKVELETLEERDTSGTFGTVNGKIAQGFSIIDDNSVLVRQDANESGSDLALDLMKEQKHLVANRAGPPAQQAANDADMEMSQTGQAKPVTRPVDSPESHRAKIFADKSSPGYNYEQTLQTALQNALAMPSEQHQTDEMVEIRIERFFPVTVKANTDKNSLFGSQIFLMRHVQIEDSHLLQGFKLNETELIAEVKQSASQLLRDGMDFELSKTESPDAAHAAILVFEFGQIVLNLMELKPHWIADQVSQLKHWYFAIVTVVLIATLLALVSLWRNLNAQIKLARKKDDFISAVSHELRTPLTTIRMYTEMLEKNWVKTDDKRTEYYTTMRHESERLTRLIENVLDFSRIQRGKKRYNFALGDINSCIREVVEMMTPCAAKQDFKIETDLSADIQSTSFDSDAVMQIVINLVDNALKYAANATDKTVTVRTRTEGKYILIEVADHGPGIPHTQRKKIFDEFYRIAEESKRETTGTGLGLALVKRFAEAHNGFVEAISAKPNGALLRVAISTTIA